MGDVTSYDVIEEYTIRFYDQMIEDDRWLSDVIKFQPQVDQIPVDYFKFQTPLFFHCGYMHSTGLISVYNLWIILQSWTSLTINNNIKRLQTYSFLIVID